MESMSSDNIIRTRIAIEHNMYAMRYDIYIAQRDPVRDTLAIAQTLVFDVHENGSCMTFPQEPALFIKDEDTHCLQELMDELWRAGIRPSASKAGDAQISAMQSHIDDLRAITFNKLGVKK